MIKYWPDGLTMARLSFDDARRTTKNINIDPWGRPGDLVLAHYDAIMDDSGGLRREAAKNNRGLGGAILEVVIYDVLLQAEACDGTEIKMGVKFGITGLDCDLVAKEVVGVAVKTSWKERWQQIGYASIALSNDIRSMFGGMIYETHGDTLKQSLDKVASVRSGKIRLDPTDYGCFADNEFMLRIIQTIKET